MQLERREMIEPGVARGEWWHRLKDRRVQCDLCPRLCKMKEGQRGFCFIRQVRNGGVVLTSYGRASGFCVDPIEKKPLNHFYPGTSVLSFGTAGCNLGCRFCQNWDIDGYVHSAPGFRGQSKVLDGASELINEVFGERGKHARLAVGISEMPLDAAVQVSMTAEVFD